MEKDVELSQLLFWNMLPISQTLKYTYSILIVFSLNSIEMYFCVCTHIGMIFMGWILICWIKRKEIILIILFNVFNGLTPLLLFYTTVSVLHYGNYGNSCSLFWETAFTEVRCEKLKWTKIESNCSALCSEMLKIKICTRTINKHTAYG